MKWPDDSPLGEARAWLRGLLDEGAKCPCCTQRAQTYRRSINSGMARSLVAMFVAGGMDWQHVPTTIPARSREEGKLRYWALVEESTEEREDGGRAGWWRITPWGNAFIHHGLQVPKYAHVYDGRCLRLDGPLVAIGDCLGSKFNLRDLLEGGE